MPVLRHFRLFCTCACAALLLASGLGAQQAAAGDSSTDRGAGASAPVVSPPATQQNRRILGVIPNYKTIDDPSQPIEPMSTKDKFKLGAKDSFDPHALPSIAFYAGVGQLEHQYPSFGQGPKGLSKRFAGSYADQAIGNMLGEAVFPSLLHEDPRYFRMAHGTFLKRTKYALSRIFLIRMDDGNSGFNFSEYLGNGVQAAISTAYYPPEDRTVSQVMSKLAFQTVTDAGFNVVKEFWPDIRRRLFQKHQESPR